jgi:hypothetical protein
VMITVPTPNQVELGRRGRDEGFRLWRHGASGRFCGQERANVGVCGAEVRSRPGRRRT